MNVTSLGSAAGAATKSVGNIVNYLEGNQPSLTPEHSKPGSAPVAIDAPGTNLGVGGYYADSGVGRWLGEGTTGAFHDLSGPVEGAQLQRLLLGQDPNTGEALMHATGSAARAGTPTTARIEKSVLSVVEVAGKQGSTLHTYVV